MSENKHIHLIGICGTAMASLAGMLKQRGFRVTGSDAAAYPPMSDFLASLAIPVAQPFADANLQPRPDLVVVGNAISRGNAELEHVLDRRIPFQSMAQVLHDEFLRSEEHTSELQSLRHLVCRLLLEKKKKRDTKDREAAIRTARPFSSVCMVPGTLPSPGCPRTDRFDILLFFFFLKDRGPPEIYPLPLPAAFPI